MMIFIDHPDIQSFLLRLQRDPLRSIIREVNRSAILFDFALNFEFRMFPVLERLFEIKVDQDYFEKLDSLKIIIGQMEKKERSLVEVSVGLAEFMKTHQDWVLGVLVLLSSTKKKDILNKAPKRIYRIYLKSYLKCLDY